MKVTEPEARKRLQHLKMQNEAEYNDLVESKEQIMKKMKDLKSILYAKFGTSINLDE